MNQNKMEEEKRDKTNTGLLTVANVSIIAANILAIFSIWWNWSNSTTIRENEDIRKIYNDSITTKFIYLGKTIDSLEALISQVKRGNISESIEAKSNKNDKSIAPSYITTTKNDKYPKAITETTEYSRYDNVSFTTAMADIYIQLRKNCPDTILTYDANGDLESDLTEVKFYKIYINNVKLTNSNVVSKQNTILKAKIKNALNIALKSDHFSIITQANQADIILKNTILTETKDKLKISLVAYIGTKIVATHISSFTAKE